MTLFSNLVAMLMGREEAQPRCTRVKSSLQNGHDVFGAIFI